MSQLCINLQNTSSVRMKFNTTVVGLTEKIRLNLLAHKIQIRKRVMKLCLEQSFKLKKLRFLYMHVSKNVKYVTVYKMLIFFPNML